LGYLLSAGVSKLTGDVTKSTEDIKFPAKLSFLQDTYLAVGSVMVPLYVILRRPVWDWLNLFVSG